MKKPLSFFQLKTCFILALMALALLLPPASMAFMDEADREKPKPEFTREGDSIVAKLIPRAKSTSVTINFAVTGGGKLTAVSAFDINKALTPQINIKDFRSELFSVTIEDVALGGDATLTVASAFFTSATCFWIFNEHLPTPWMDSQAENIPLGDKVQKFIIRIKDGGPFDSDGAANGRIILVGGPSDSFWGYVLGTLFIRFFGVFIVLSVLMIGMLISGWIFQKLEKKPEEARPAMPPAEPRPLAQAQPPSRPAPKADEIPPEMAAAIGMVLSLNMSPRSSGKFSQKTDFVVPTAWALDGRRQMMADRNMVFNRIKR